MVYIIGDIQLKDNKEDLGWGYNHTGLLKFFESLPLTKNDIVIQVGDFFDKTMHKGYTNKSAIAAVQYLANKASMVFIIDGNHDCSKYSGSNLDTLALSDNVHIIKDIFATRTVMPDAGMFLFLPYIEGLNPGGKYEEKVNEYLAENNIAGVDYIIGHHFFKENTVMDNPYLDLDKLNVEYAYCFMGHNHKFQKISDKKYCTGAICPDTKGEKDYEYNYLVIGENGVEIKPVPLDCFLQFIGVDWGDPEANIDFNKTFVLVRAACKKEEKYLLEQEIRKKYPKNLYEIDFIFEEEEKTEKIDVKSDDDLVELFFKENEYTKSVTDHFWGYYR